MTILKKDLSSRLKRVKPCRRKIGLTISGLNEPESYGVSQDVYEIVRKLLALNQFVGPYRGVELVEFEEVKFLLQILGVQLPNADSRYDLLIAED